MAQTARTPRIQLVLNVHEEEQREKIRRVTKGHEVVEVDGFVFKRRRTVAPPENAQPNSLLAWHAAAPPPPFAQQLGAVDADAEVLDVSEQLAARMVPALCALPADAPPADALRIIVGSVCAAEAERMAADTPSGVPSAGVAPALEAFVAALDDALHCGRIALAPPATAAHADAAASAPGDEYKMDLQIRKAGMRARLAALEQEEGQWNALLDEIARLDAPTEDADAEAAAQEEGRAGDGMQEASGVPAAAASLRRTHTAVHRELAMQVEGMCKLVGDMEELLAAANMAAHTMQAEYHSEKFRTFPHVDSPARLIRELVRPPLPGVAATATEAADAVAPPCAQA